MSVCGAVFAEVTRMESLPKDSLPKDSAHKDSSPQNSIDRRQFLAASGGLLVRARNIIG